MGTRLCATLLPSAAMPPSFDIAAALRSWDGRDVLAFAEVANVLPVTPASVAELVRLVRCAERVPDGDEAVQVGATWVIKHWLESGHSFNRRVCGQVAALLQGELCWGATLHLLVMLPRLDLTTARLLQLRSRLDDYCESSSPFVRAWAYNGLGLLVVRDPSLRPEIDALFDTAMAEDKASVRARIRNVRKSW